MADTLASTLERHLDRCWYPDTVKAWALGQVLSLDREVEESEVGEPAGGVVLLRPVDDDSAEPVQLLLSDTHAYNISHSEDHDDVCEMDDLHEAPLLSVLVARHRRDAIYTWAGDVLISMNPFKDIENMYSMERYRSAGAQPHVYAVADRAYQQMVDATKDQSILVNGESGAGKTEASKHMMRYLVAVSRQRRVAMGASEPKIDVETCVLESNVLLEAFGNAKTVRNDNSSRFGKFVRLLYNESGSIQGATTECFLLEKSRLTEQSSGERNYHVLFQLVSAMGENGGADVDGELRLRGHEYYAYLNGGRREGIDSSTKCVSPVLDGVDDIEEFGRLQASFAAMGVALGETKGLFKVLAGILNLGNVAFFEDSDRRAVLSENSTHSLMETCRLLGFDLEEIKEALVERRFTSGRGSVSEVPLTAHDAACCRDGLAKYIYSACFSYVVRKINEVTKFAGTGVSIGILDIFGFEILETNSFEQLCINFANEMLQQAFNHHSFDLEQEYYEREEIDWSRLTFKDNQDVIDLLSKPPLGIFCILDEQGMLGDNATDQAFLANVNKNHDGRSARFSSPRIGGRDECFEILHYAGTVRYDIKDFMSKNNDALTFDLLMIAHQTKDPFLKAILDGAEISEFQTSRGDESATPKKMMGTRTVGGRFRSQMAELRSRLDSTKLSFVRCVKPNNAKAPAPNLDPHLVLNQLRFLGVMETVRIRREGYPVRREFAELLEKYSVLLPTYDISGAPIDYGALDDREKCRRLLERVFPSQLATIYEEDEEGAHWQIGKNRVFLRDGQLQGHVRARRRAKQVKHSRDKGMAALKIQASWHTSQARKAYAAQRQAALRIEASARASSARKKYLAKCRAAVVMENAARAHQERQRFLAYKNAAIVVENAARAHLERQRYILQQSSALKLEAFVRGHRARIETNNRRNNYNAAAKSLQAAQRRRVARQHYDAQRIAAMKLETMIRGKLARTKLVDARAAALRLQAWSRQHISRARYLDMVGTRDEWKGILLPNEAVVASSLVRKRRAVKYTAGLITTNKRRQLIFTTRQRLLYVKLEDMSLKGNINMQHAIVKYVIDTSVEDQVLAVSRTSSRPSRLMSMAPSEEDDKLTGVGRELDVKDDRNFDVVNSEGMVYQFTDLMGPAIRWADAVDHGPRSVFDLLTGPRHSLRRATRGYLSQVKRAVKSAKNWRKRYFVLCGTQLLWFKYKTDKEPTGQVQLSADCLFASTDETGMDFTFKLVGSSVPNGLFLQAECRDDMRMWLKSINFELELLQGELLRH